MRTRHENIGSDAVQALKATARGVNVELGAGEARVLLEARGVEAASYLVLSIGALTTRAELQYGLHVLRDAAIRLLDRHAGDFDAAVGELDNAFGRRIDAAYNRLERRHFSRDAHQRHAVFVGQHMAGTLGHQAGILIAAAADAELTDPDADKYRKDLLAAVDRELGRRYPTRDTITTAVEGSRHFGMVDDAVAKEAYAKHLVLLKLPTLARRIDGLHSRGLRRDITVTLDKIRERLSRRQLQGWIPDPERYAREVLEVLMEEARTAS